jgi:hypothetical protein
MGKVIVRSVAVTHFTTELIQHAIEKEAFTGLGINHGVIRSVVIESIQNLDWDLYFWENSTYSSTDLDLDKAIGWCSLANTTGFQIAAANQFYYTKHDLYIPIRNLAHNETLYVGLVNRNATQKEADAAGYITVTLVIEEL